MKANELLDKALDFIVETQEQNDYICEQMCEDFVGDYCEKNCQNLSKECVKLFLQKVYNKNRDMKAKEEKEKHDEMMERFRLYGEIFILCQENGIDIDNFFVEDDEWEDGYGIEQTFEVICDDGECGKMNTIKFDDGMLSVGYKNILAPFFEVTSKTLENVLFIMNAVIKDEL